MELLRLVNELATAAHRAVRVEDAIATLLEGICSYNRWHLGHAFIRAKDGNGFVSTGIWHADPEVERDFSRLRRASSESRFSGADAGLIAEVLRCGRSVWIDDVREDDRFQRGGDELNVRTAVGVPVLVDRTVEVIFEFYSGEVIPREHQALEAMEIIAMQLGHVLERKRFEKEIAQISDREQRRVGRVVHDTLGQQIVGLGMILGSLHEKLRSEGSAHVDVVSELLGIVDEAKAQVRDLIKGRLSIDLDSEGLVRELADLAKRVDAAYDVECVFECPEPILVEDSFEANQIFRIAYEAVYNAVRHANASRIDVRLRRGSMGELVVQDDGIGFDPDVDSEGEGLRIMRHRARLVGRLSIGPAPEGGTIVGLAFRASGLDRG